MTEPGPRLHRVRALVREARDKEAFDRQVEQLRAEGRRPVNG